MGRLLGDLKPFTLCYTPYGYAVGIEGWGDVAFKGERRDFWGVYHLGLGRRVYSCSLMRFLSADLLSPFSKGGMNAYSYCAGDPVNFSDPSGAMRRSSAKPAPMKAGRKQVTWMEGGVEDKGGVALISPRSVQVATTSRKTILKYKYTGPSDTTLPAVPMKYEAPMMTSGQFQELLNSLALRKLEMSDLTPGSKAHREAVVGVSQVTRLVKEQIGIRQDNDLHDLTKSRFRFKQPKDDGLAYPDEPKPDYD
ncbi:hypothetical protein D3C76_604750 [compost metagenome]